MADLNRSLHLAITIPFHSHLLDKIQAVSPFIRLEQLNLGDHKWPEGKSCLAEILYTGGAIPRPEQAPQLRWVQLHWAGTDSLSQHPLWNSNILITNSSGIHAPNMAQYTFAQILAWAHHLPRLVRQQQQREWPKERRNELTPTELRGKTLGILGYGSIGREIARLGKAFGLTVLATKRDARRLADVGFGLAGVGDPAGTMADRIYPPEATRSMLAECDYVVIALPLTGRTRGLFDEELFKAMKPTAFLVNIGRGAIIKEGDLIKALKKGWLAGAGLDVFEKEPLPADSPLWNMDNVLITPHISGSSRDYDERAVQLFCQNLDHYLSGRELLNLVSREIGY